MRKKSLMTSILAMTMAAVMAAGCGTSSGSAGTDTGALGEDKSSESAQAAQEETPADTGTEEKMKFTLSLMQGNEDKDYLTSIMEDIVAEYPNVTLEVEQIATGDYPTKMGLNVSSGNVADLSEYWRPDISHGGLEYCKVGVFADVTELFETEFAGQFTEDTLNTCKVEGVQYAFPGQYSFIMFMANKAILDDCGLEVPQTWEELKASIPIIQEKGYIPWGVSTKAYGSAWERPLDYIFARYVGCAGDTGYLNMFAGNVPFDTDEAVAACRDLASIVSGYSAADSMSMDDTQIISKYINTGKACYSIAGSYNMAQFDEAILDNMVAMKWPEMPGAEAMSGDISDKSLSGVFYAGADAWENPVKKEIITKFFRKFYSQENADIMYSKFGSMVPTRNLKITEEDAPGVFIESKEIADNATGILWYLSNADSDKRDQFYSFYQQLWFGQIDGDEFAKQCQELFYNGGN